MNKILIIGPRHYIDDLKSYFSDDRVEIKYLYEDKIPRDRLEQYSKKLIEAKYGGFIGLVDWSSLYASYLNAVNGSSGPNPQVVARLQDKFLSRKVQKDAGVYKKRVYDARQAEKIDADDFPMFIKPRRASMSFMASQVERIKQINEIASDKNQKLLETKNQNWKKLYELLGLPKDIKQGLDGFVVEPLLGHGSQLTLDGFIQGRKVEFLGFTKSVFMNNHLSFKRFDYPLKISKKLQKKMRKHAKKFIKNSGLKNSMFNIEYKYDEHNKSFELIEINTRPSSQFMYSIMSVTGVHPLNIAISIVTGDRARFKEMKTNHKVSSVCIFRRSEDAVVKDTPSLTDMKWFYDEHPHGRWNIFAIEGEKLSDHPNDSHTFRYAELIILHKDSLPVHSFEDELKEKFDKKIEFMNINES